MIPTSLQGIEYVTTSHTNATTDNDDRPLLRIGHSPDPDDAFMWFPITGTDEQPPLIDTGRFRFEAVQQDIETLNQRSSVGDLEITAISIAQYPFIAETYALTHCGASMGDGYGPKIVAKPNAVDTTNPNAIRDFLLNSKGEAAGQKDAVGSSGGVAVPGERTSALLATSLMLGTNNFDWHAVPFDQIMNRVTSGEYRAGVVIHEGQLTYKKEGLVLLADLGEWWTAKTSLPLPLGGNAIRRDLDTQFGAGSILEITKLLSQSIRYALDHREQAVDIALKFGRGLDRALADEFVAMYVNEHTIDFGKRGRAGVLQFLSDAHNADLVPGFDTTESVVFVG